MPRYAEIEDVESLAIVAAALESVSDTDKNRALDAASSEADALMGTKHPAPLTEWPLAVTLHVAKMSAFHMMSMRGYRPGSVDELIRLGYEDGIKFFSKVGAGKAVLPVSQVAPAAGSVPSFSSERERGWGRGDGV